VSNREIGNLHGSIESISDNLPSKSIGIKTSIKLVEKMRMPCKKIRVRNLSLIIIKY